MELVADANVLFSLFRETSGTKKFLLKSELILFSPEFVLLEINKHSAEVMKKAGISLPEFKRIIEELKLFVEFVPMPEYREFLELAGNIVPDPNDIDFFALALKLNVPLWSNDAHLKKQDKVRVLSTKELIEMSASFLKQ